MPWATMQYVDQVANCISSTVIILSLWYFSNIVILTICVLTLAVLSMCLHSQYCLCAYTRSTVYVLTLAVLSMCLLLAVLQSSSDVGELNRERGWRKGDRPTVWAEFHFAYSHYIHYTFPWSETEGKLL